MVCKAATCGRARNLLERNAFCWATRAASARGTCRAGTCAAKPSAFCTPLRQPTQARRARGVATRGLIKSLFGNQNGDVQESEDPAVPLSQPEQQETENGEIVLSEVENEGGTARIVYRPGGLVNMRELEELSSKVGWPMRSAEKTKGALENSFLVCSLTLEVQPLESGAEPSSKLIGLARATSDHAFNATIWDVAVDPEFQGKGLGKALVEQMVRHLLRRGISNITLFADANVVEFYRKMGFEADPNGIKGMFWYPKF